MGIAGSGACQFVGQQSGVGGAGCVTAASDSAFACYSRLLAVDSKELFREFAKRGKFD
jgi:hypothetical protein